MLIDHVNLRCNDPDAMASFLEQVGCAKRGHRPAFGSHGHWLYDDSDVAVIHISSRTTPHAANGVVDHVAFRLDNDEGLRERLNEHGLSFSEVANNAANVIQVVIEGPEGIVIEIQLPCG